MLQGSTVNLRVTELMVLAAIERDELNRVMYAGVNGGSAWGLSMQDGCYSQPASQLLASGNTSQPRQQTNREDKTQL